MLLSASAHVWGAWVSLVLAVLGVTLNCTTLAVVGAERRLRRQPSTAIVLGLSLVDGLYCGLILPGNAAAAFHCRFCYSGSLVCVVYAYLFYALMGCIVFLQAALAVNRWAAVCTKHYVTLRQTYLMMGVFCLVPLLLPLLPALGLWGSLGWHQQTGSCTILTAGGEAVGTFFRLVGPCLPYSLIVICYILIIRTLKMSRKRVTLNGVPSIQVPTETTIPKTEGQHNDVSPSVTRKDQLSVRQPARSQSIISNDRSYVVTLQKHQSAKLKRRKRREQGMTVTVGVILISYVCCNLPAMIVTLLDPSGEQLPEAHIPTLILLWMSGVVNPVVYVVFNPLYRKAFCKRVHGLKPCCLSN